MKREKKNKILANLKIIGLHYEKYNLSMIIVASIVALIALFFCIYWEFDETTAGDIIDYTYLYAYIAFLVLSVVVITFLLLNRFKIIKTMPLAILVHVYVFLLVGWGTFVCTLDLSIGISPFIYVIIVTALAGLFIVEPFFYAFLILVSFFVMMLLNGINDFAFFKNDYMIENIVDVFMFIAIIIATAFRHFHITIKEFRYQKELEHLTYFDELTGLLNERSYVNSVEEINQNIKEGKIDKFAVVVMDVNNLKATNDAYGHRYGCHLVVRCGHTLPEVFKTSKLFHVGGDEFLAIVMGEDLKKFEETMQNFIETFDYSLIQYEGQELIFSVAHGYSLYQEGDRFADVLQRADNEMYGNKKALKEKYGMKGR